METIKIKPEFNEKLINLGIKTRFLKNLKTLLPPPHRSGFKQIYGTINPTTEDRIKYLNSMVEWRYFILRAFVWSHSQEGQHYWWKVTQEGDFRSIPICTDSLIIFKPEFEEKLHQLRIKQKFVKKFKEDRSSEYQRTRWEYLNQQSNWKKFIANAFYWGYSEKEHQYWNEISLKFENDK